ncbi:hypothetical protein FOL46_003396 [Perkinsus olseni]|uniref:Uncharacterized protein n=1 Tax=Perkinsus olseni TaxID=32597 RepID=A0A7J6MTN4_PEROL|nr:hypothetical protein FOL46_003396 [Perkinsus olseni]
MSIIITLLTIYFSCFLFLGCDIDQGASDPATAAAAWSFSNGYLPNPCSVACARTIGCEESSCTPVGECAGLYVATGLELCYGDTADDCPANAEPLPCTSGGDVRDPDVIEETKEGVLVESGQSVDQPKIKDTEIPEKKEETVGEAGKEAEAKPKSVAQDEEAKPTATSQSGEELKPQEVADLEEQAEWRRGGSEKADLLQGEPSSEEKTKPEESHPEAKPESGETEPEAKPESGETESGVEPESVETEPEAKPESGETEPEAKPESVETEPEAKPESGGTESGVKPELVETEPEAKPGSGETEPEAKPEERAEKEVEDQVDPKEVELEGEDEPTKPKGGAESKEPTKPEKGTESREEANPSRQSTRFGRVEAMSKAATTEAPTKELHASCSPPTPEQSEAEPGYRAKDPESEEVVPGKIGSAEEGGSTQEQYKMPGSQEEESSEHWLARSPELAEGKELPAGKPSSHQEAAVAESEPTEGGSGQAMSPESEEVFGGGTYTQEKPSCPYLRGEGYTALPTSEGDKAVATVATEATEGMAPGVTEAKACKTTEGKAKDKATGVTEAKASEPTEGKASKTTKGDASEPTEGKVTESSEAGATETSKSGETGILREVGGTGGPTSAKGWSTIPGSASASPSSEELFLEHKGLATGIRSHGGERVEASRRPPAADTTTLPTRPITSRPAKEVPYKFVYEPPVLHHGDEPATSWTDEQVATHGRAEASTEKPSDSEPFRDPVWSGTGEEGSLDFGFWYFRGHDQHHHDRHHDQHRDHGHRRRHRDDRRQRYHRH